MLLLLTLLLNSPCFLLVYLQLVLLSSFNLFVCFFSDFFSFLLLSFSLFVHIVFAWLVLCLFVCFFLFDFYFMPSSFCFYLFICLLTLFVSLFVAFLLCLYVCFFFYDFFQACFAFIVLFVYSPCFFWFICSLFYCGCFFVCFFSEFVLFCFHLLLSPLSLFVSLFAAFLLWLFTLLTKRSGARCLLWFSVQTSWQLEAIRVPSKANTQHEYKYGNVHLGKYATWIKIQIYVHLWTQ